MVQRIDTLDKYASRAEMGSTVASVIAPGTESATARAAVRTGAIEASALADAGAVAEAGATAARASGGLWTGIRTIAGRIATPLMLLAGGFQTAKAVKKKNGHEAAEAAGGTVGGIAGMWAAAAVTGPMGWLAALGVGIATTVAGGWIGSKATDGLVGDKWHQSLNSGPLPPRRIPPAGYHIQQLPVATDNRPGSFFTQRIQQERAEKQRIAEQQSRPQGMGH